VPTWTQRSSLETAGIPLSGARSSRPKQQALAELGVLARWSNEILSGSQRRLAEARSAPGGLAAQVAEARVHESTAAELFGALLQVAGALEDIAAGLPAGSLGRRSKPDLEQEVEAAITGVSRTLDGAFDEVALAAEQAAAAGRLQNAPWSERWAAIQILLRTAKFDCLARPWPPAGGLTEGPPDTRPLAAFLEELAGHLQTRLPHRAAALRREAQILTEESSYPLSSTSNRMVQLRRDFGRAMVKLKAYMATEYR
jgi:hypothetical protein